MKCSVCESPNLTQPHDYASFEHHVRIKGAGSGGWLGKKDLTLKPSKARICNECGHLMLFINQADLRLLAEGGAI